MERLTLRTFSFLLLAGCLLIWVSVAGADGFAAAAGRDRPTSGRHAVGPCCGDRCCWHTGVFRPLGTAVLEAHLHQPAVSTDGREPAWRDQCRFPERRLRLRCLRRRDQNLVDHRGLACPPVFSLGRASQSTAHPRHRNERRVMDPHHRESPAGRARGRGGNQPCLSRCDREDTRRFEPP